MGISVASSVKACLFGPEGTRQILPEKRLELPKLQRKISNFLSLLFA